MAVATFSNLWPCEGTPGWFPSMLLTPSAAWKGLWSPSSEGVLLHSYLQTQMPKALYRTVLHLVFFIYWLSLRVCDTHSLSQIHSCWKLPAELIDSAKEQAGTKGMDWILIFKGPNDLCPAVHHVGFPPSTLHFAGAHLQCGLVLFTLLIILLCPPSHPSLRLYIRDTHEDSQTTLQIDWSALHFGFMALIFYLVLMKTSWTAQERSKDSVKSHFLNLPHSLCAHHWMNE